jgi:hypothetical protein
MNITIDNNSLEHIKEKIDGVKIYSVKNVINYKYHKSRYDILYKNNIVTPEHKYFLIESTGNEAFAHWVIESSILLSVFKKLKSLYPMIKLYLLCSKQFKTLFLNHCNISQNDISYTLEPNNECFLAEPFTIFDNKPEYSLHFRYVVDFFNSIRPDILPVKDIDILFLPRQTKENYISNNRTHNTKELEDVILLMNNCYVLHTDKLTDLKDQINFILRAKNIIVTDGSPYLINSLISLNANIICIGDAVLSQILGFTEMKMIQSIIESSNKVHTVKYKNYTFESIKHLLFNIDT